MGYGGSVMNKIRLILYKLGFLKKKRIHKSYRYIKDFDFKYPFGRSLVKSEQQIYLDKNVNKNKDVYNLIIKKEDVRINPQWNLPEDDFKYTSGMLWSKDKYLYGSFETEVFIPVGRGLWSAFWLYGDDDKGFTEIDIFEYYGDIHKYSYNTHYGADYDNNISKGGEAIIAKKLENSWHKYRLDWDEGENLKFYLDDKLVGVRDGKPFNKPMHLIINMAVQKNIGNKLDKYLPTIMKVKNIRYYGI